MSPVSSFTDSIPSYERSKKAILCDYSSSLDRAPSHHESSPISFIHRLSTELIAHIFARLDPVSLSVVAGTCKYWQYIVMDDVCWKNALVAYFGRLPYKRIQTSSWKAEYILRTHLVRKWEKGRGTLLTFNPKVGSIDTGFVDFKEDLMMVTSKEQGVSVQCHPSTGKLNRHLVYSTDESMPITVSALEMDSNRILWGFSSGYVTLAIRTKSLGRRQLLTFSDFHQGAIRALCLLSFLPDVVLSAGDDGMVKIWSVSNGLSIAGLHGSTSSPTCLEATSDHHVMTGYTNGTIVLWDIQLQKLHQQRRHGITEEEENANDDTIYRRRLIHAPLSDRQTPVRSMHYDTKTQTLLVTYDGLCKLYQYDIHSGQLQTVFGGDSDQHLNGHTLGPISAITWDIEPSFKFTDEIHPKNRNSPLSTPTQRLVATGDTSGTICLWPLDSHDETKIIHPLRLFHGHESAISAIYLDAFKMVSGAEDGWIRIWDPLTGELLHILGNKIPRHAPIDRTDVSLMRVKTIFCDEYRGVATIGHQVKSWDFSNTSHPSGRRILRQKSKAPGPTIRDELHYEIKEQVLSSELTLAEERKERILAAKEMNKWTMGGLSDEEIMAYTMMISQESVDHTTGVPDEDEALLQAIMASLDISKQGCSSNHDCPLLSSSSVSSSSSLKRNNDDDDHNDFTTTATNLMDYDVDWPRVGTSTRNDSYTDDDDEELQYVLRLSLNDT